MMLRRLTFQMLEAVLAVLAVMAAMVAEEEVAAGVRIRLRIQL